MAATTAPAVNPHNAAIPRPDRLDVMLGHLEGVKGGKTRQSSSTSPTVTNSSMGWSPRSVDSYRPFDEVIEETKAKGPLINRLQRLEDHVLELSLQVGEAEKRAREEKLSPRRRKKALRRLVESCVGRRSMPED